ncbi:MAG TPA: DNA mismatch repair endonuclease MutH [Polyangiaceae bacterium]|nr:DNA mismatch repair endonuclease MutH [Polyangiaceae bacterium]
MLCPPTTEAELLARADALAGESIESVAAKLGVAVPSDLSRHKGWVGNFVERALGASAGSKPEPDFAGLGIELKTLPVDDSGKPFESTFVCTISMSELCDVEWDDSRVRRKLARVLWMPVQGDRRLELCKRRFGAALLWAPDTEELSALRFDWEELAGVVVRLGFEAVTGHAGRFLQIRPKARDSSVRRRGLDADGALISELPRGFYLRQCFTAEILRKNFAIAVAPRA